MADIFTIDGIAFNLGVVELTREAEVLDKYAERTFGDGVLHREVLGTYFNYTLKLSANNTDLNAYTQLYNIAVSPVESHEIVVPFNDGYIKYRAYITGVSDKLTKVHKGKNYWDDLQLKFIAKSPNIVA